MQSLSEEVREEELDDSERHEALRKYQKDRSRYYYGIVEFDTADQAMLLYDEMDGVEAYFAFAGLDLRFVPSDVTFERQPTSECREMPSNYEPPMASESAFRHSRVECKWDMPSMKRFKTLTKRLVFSVSIVYVDRFTDSRKRTLILWILRTTLLLTMRRWMLPNTSL